MSHACCIFLIHHTAHHARFPSRTWASHLFEAHSARRIEDLQKEYNQKPWVMIEEGQNGYPVAVLLNRDGVRAEVSFQGSHITSWTDQNDKEMLFLHPDNDFDPSQPIQ
jgi:hypothetical protein